jgi:serine/threonine-protein kinase HipA
VATSISSPRTAYVYIRLGGASPGYVPAGRLQYYPESQSSRFEYGRRYHERPGAVPLDPVTMPLGLAEPVDTRPGRHLHNVFLDAAPDRWGRRVLSFLAGVPPDELSPFDLLVAAHSESRIGALAFGPDPESGPRSMAPWCQGDVFTKTNADLRPIVRLVRRIGEQDEDGDLEFLRGELPAGDHLLRALVYSVFTVGGGRPKAMIDEGGAKWIAKFPKRGDGWNDPLVEHATMTLAARCGILVPETKIVTMDGVDILLVRRFDRDESGQPRHMISGFTLRDLAEDGDWGSYQELANRARRCQDERAGEQLFRRIIMNILCSNFDDHPKNHAFFVRPDSSVSLSPAYDIVPQKLSSGNLAFACGRQGHAATLENALSWPEPFNLSARDAREVVRSMLEMARGWEGHFEECGVPGRDIARLRSKFLNTQERI